MRNREQRAGRPVVAAAVIAVVAAIAPAAGCFNVDTAHPTGAECGGQTVEDADGCEGLVCIPLVANQQGVPGLCSAPCNVDEECTPHDKCVQIDTEAFCLRACLTDADCYDRTVCRLFAPGNATRFCLADPL